jgi:hypothetical protein
LFRVALGDIRVAILGFYRLALTASLATVNSALSVLGTLTATGKITASAGVDVTGTLAVIDDGGTTKKVTVDAPTGLAADYMLTLPTALPGSTLPVTLTSVGVLSTAQMVNAQQNFGTPSASTDVVIKSYVDGTTASVTSQNANISSVAPVMSKTSGGTLATFASQAITVSGAIASMTPAGSTAGAGSLWLTPAGYRPKGVGFFPVWWFDSSANLMRSGSLYYAAGASFNWFFLGLSDTSTQIDLANGDIIYLFGVSFDPA